MKIRYLLVLPLAASVVLLGPPGTAAATTYEGQSHTSAAVTATVRSGDTAWALSARLCGRGDLHSRLTIRSPQGALRVNHDRIWPSDRVTGSCLGGPVAAPRPATNAGGVRSWVRPVAGGWFGRGGCFGDPRRHGPHQGVDITLPAGRPIVAAHAGTVARAGWWSGGYGISVLVHHGSGLYTHYAHMSSRTVSVGQRVNTGQMLGRVGRTGDATGPHLHFEVWRGWWNQESPRPFMAARGVTGFGC